MEKLKTRDKHDNEADVINGAYGLVQGVLGTFGDLNSDQGYREFQRPEIQAAAMEAARDFVRKINRAN
jgi:hypothetical protein